MVQVTCRWCILVSGGLLSLLESGSGCYRTAHHLHLALDQIIFRTATSSEIGEEMGLPGLEKSRTRGGDRTFIVFCIVVVPRRVAAN